jgi:hypothetical protein
MNAFLSFTSGFSRVTRPLINLGNRLNGFRLPESDPHQAKAWCE